MSEPIRLAVVGATGALGRQILLALERAELPLAELIPVASRATRQATVSFSGNELPVHDETTTDLSGVDIILAATPPTYDRDAFLPALDRGAVVVDLAGLWAESPEVPVVAPWANEADLDQVMTAGVVRSPRPLAIALAAIAQPLHAALGVSGLRGLAMLPAVLAGREGTEELSRQVVGLFNSSEPPRKVFPDGLAFDVIPAWGEVGAEGWTDYEQLVAQDVGVLTGMEPRALAITAVMAPLFAGMGISLHVVTDGMLGLEEVKLLLSQAPRVALMEQEIKPLMTRARVDMDAVAVGRLRADPMGAGVHLWAACDPTRLAAVNAVELAVQIAAGGYL